MLGYIFIAIFVIIAIYIIVQYSINAKKIKSKSTKKVEEKPDKKTVSKTTNDKKGADVEVKSTIISGTAVEQAIQEEEQKNNQKTKTENNKQTKIDNSRLKLDREDFVGEIQKMNANKISSEYNKIGVEGPATKSLKNKQVKKVQQKSVADNIKDLPPEIKALLLNDILNKKY